ncbi:polysaccharide export outer membrane protein [Mesonia phycicola]|uniref:Polysaccharide export outer membrane protein n=1 Tax=Mesonia phycicola TaxID=579105 RepID=A0A1M6H258_9FLAO|nr:polysaccharide biosynthesis/export family protein [Mesonia phycicola]SHJ16271.1 polysaccharide export outer membrane protein [Mesonia phycicola]
MKKLLFLFLLLTIASCATRKEIVYFQGDSEVSLDSIYQHPKIQVNDILKIDLTALEPESLLPYRFDKTQISQTNNIQGSSLKLQGYLVRTNGTINYPGLGDIEVKGLTTIAVQQLIKDKLSVYVKDVEVKVRIVNFKFTVLGEVNIPGTYTIDEELISLTQALGMAGDLTIQGSRKILVLREVDGQLTSKRIDLTTTSWMNSEYFYLRQNDMVYVEPNPTKIKSAGFIGNLGSLLSVISILLTSAVLIFR